LSREDLIKHFVSVEFNRFLAYYKNTPDLNVDGGGGGYDDGYKKKPAGKASYTRFHINIGLSQGVNPARLIGLINESTRNRNIPVGKIDLLKNFSFFEVEKRFEEEIRKAFKGVFFEGIKVHLDVAKPETWGKQKEVYTGRTKKRTPFTKKKNW
jgi:ATP-dependent RNA helicase DeaD